MIIQPFLPIIKTNREIRKSWKDSKRRDSQKRQIDNKSGKGDRRRNGNRSKRRNSQKRKGNNKSGTINKRKNGNRSKRRNSKKRQGKNLIL